MTTIQTLDQALAHLGANDPLRPDACKTLLDYMDSAKQSESAGRPVAPSDWEGCRALTIK